MYTEGTNELDRERDELSNTFSEYLTEMEWMAYDITEERLEKDWLKAFWYSFGDKKMSTNFEYFAKFLEDMYLDSAGTGQAKTVKYTMLVLRKLCEYCEKTNAPESFYKPVKFFVLACLAREKDLEQKVRALCKNERKDDDAQTRSLDYFFDFVRSEISDMMQSPITEFNAGSFMTDFLTRCLIEYEGISDEHVKGGWIGGVFSVSSQQVVGELESREKFSKVAHRNVSAKREENLAKSQASLLERLQFSPSLFGKSDARRVMGPLSTKDYGSDLDPDIDSDSESAPDSLLNSDSNARVRIEKKETTKTTTETGPIEKGDETARNSVAVKKRKRSGDDVQKLGGEPKAKKARRSDGLPLPDMYDPKYESAYIAAIDERNDAIAYYVLTSFIISLYTNNAHGLPIPKAFLGPNETVSVPLNRRGRV